MKFIRTIDDVLPSIAGKKEFRVAEGAFGTKIIAADFQCDTTYDNEGAVECRGITFDSDGKILSRPLHKFFNINEKPSTQEYIIRSRIRNGELLSIREKIDGSMIHTCLVDGKIRAKSKKSFTSDVAVTAQKMIEADPMLSRFCRSCAEAGNTPIFELVHPSHQIVVRHHTPKLRLLHVRENMTGSYLYLSFVPSEMDVVPDIIDIHLDDAMKRLATARDMEGYVLQFRNGDMVKLKCSWYLNLHGTITFMRERDVAAHALHCTLDDVRAMLADVGISPHRVDEIERDVMDRMCSITRETEETVAADNHLTVKEFALKHQRHPLFALMITLFKNHEPDYVKFFEKNILEKAFTNDVICHIEG